MNHVSLAELTEDAAPRMLAWLLDPLIRQGIGLRTEPTLERTLEWIRSAGSDATCRPFAILLAGTHVGNVVLDRIDRYLGTARLSIYLGAQTARGKGVGQAVVRLAARTAFEELGLHKVWLTVHAENEVALRTYTKVGFRVEGRLRDEFLLDGRRIDALYMGLLKGELPGEANP